jgi:hypothetical protein
MLMPDKHIKFGESLLGLSSYVLESLASPRTIDDLWNDYRSAVKQGQYPAAHTFEHLVLAVDVLFTISAVEESDRAGVLQRCA